MNICDIHIRYRAPLPGRAGCDGEVRSEAVEPSKVWLRVTEELIFTFY